MYSSKRILWQMIGLAAFAAVLASCSAVSPTQDTGAATVQTATVKTITAVTTATGSGSTVALQSVSVYWKTTAGAVGTVNVKPGDQVALAQAATTTTTGGGFGGLGGLFGGGGGGARP